MARWSLDKIPWHLFEAEKVNADLLALAKTASVVEYNSADYVTYLKKVFAGDDEFCAAIEVWGEEEKLHGEALAKWAELADPSFNFEAALAKFRAAYQVPLNVEQSIRGSRTGELVARCMVECGTTSYYSCLKDASEEPVLKAISRFIAADEVQHFNLFYRMLLRYEAKEPLSTFAKVKIAVQRSAEVEDEELLYAFAATNLPGEIRATKMDEYLAGYMGRACDIYTKKNLRKGMALAVRAVGLEKFTKLPDLIASVGMIAVQRKAYKLRESSGVAALPEKAQVWRDPVIASRQFSSNTPHIN